MSVVLTVGPDFSSYAVQLMTALRAGGRVDDWLVPTERTALAWLQGHLPTRAPVLECRCESGRFLAALRDRGFLAYGLDLSPAHVAILQTHGFAVTRGDLPEYPAAWPDPAAVVLLESLVRVSDPGAWLISVRARWPGALVLVTVPAARRAPEYRAPDGGSWSAARLADCLKGAGYRTEVVTVRAGWRDLKGPRLFRLLEERLMGSPLAGVARAARMVAQKGAATIGGIFGRLDESHLAFGVPA